MGVRIPPVAPFSTMLKILDPNNRRSPYLSFRDFFDLNNPGNYQFIEDHTYNQSVDFLIQNHIANYPSYSMYKFKALLFLDIRHNQENQIARLNLGSPDRFVITNARDFDVQNSRILFNDYLFNRTKAYYSNYAFSQSTVWNRGVPGTYAIPQDQINGKTAIYIAPNRTYFDPEYPEQRVCRKCIMQFLKDNHRHQGHLGDSYDPDIGDLPSNCVNHRWKGYNPPATKFYENTFISIFAETLEFGSTFVATEKTFDPLIKGHFVLPFSSQNYIKQLTKHYGFKFPNFIDYSYDEIDNKHQRLEAYLNEIKRLLSMPIETWKEHWVNHKDLRQHNQQIFQTKDYHRIDLTFLLE